MKRLAGAMASAALWSCGNPSAGPAAQLTGTNEISGPWEMTVLAFGEENIRRLRLDVTGNRITGRASQMGVEGNFRGNTVEFQVRLSNGKIFGNFMGRLQSNEMAGEEKVSGGPATWTGRLPKARPPEAVRIHNFEPKEYYRTFSYAILRVLRIFPGDTVRTKTIDAASLDGNFVRQANEGNPLTDPFYVEGALPEDTLVVHFNPIRLNRESAISGHRIDYAVVAPSYLSSISPVENFDSHWKLDREQGGARLANPTVALKDYTVPLRPTLGCVGVAPKDKQAWSAHLLEDFGRKS